MSDRAALEREVEEARERMVRVIAEGAAKATLLGGSQDDAVAASRAAIAAYDRALHALTMHKVREVVDRVPRWGYTEVDREVRPLDAGWLVHKGELTAALATLDPEGA